MIVEYFIKKYTGKLANEFLDKYDLEDLDGMKKQLDKIIDISKDVNDILVKLRKDIDDDEIDEDEIEDTFCLFEKLLSKYFSDIKDKEDEK